MRSTLDQTLALTTLEQAHAIKRVPDDWYAAEVILPECVSDARLYGCSECGSLFTIEPDGTVMVWCFVEYDGEIRPQGSE